MAKNTQLYSNNAETTLASPISSGDLTITVTDGSKFPSPSAGQYFLATIEVGASYEIVKIESRTGNTFTVAVSGRGQEGTTAASWPSGALIEMRITKDTLTRFSRYTDVMYELSGINDLLAPSDSDGNSYITHSVDDGGNPIVAVRNNSSIWRFISHKKVLISGTATAGTNTTTQLTSTDIASLVTNVTSGKYILQFTNGALAGQSRLITSSSTNTVSWSGALTTTPTSGVTTFEIYQSDLSSITAGSFLPTSGGTMTGAIVLAGDGSSALHPISKQQWDAQNTAVTNSLALKAPLASPTFTGTVAAPTVTPASDASTKVATTQFVHDVADPMLPKAGGTMTGDLTVNASTILAQQIRMSGVNLTTQLSSNTDNYNPTNLATSSCLLVSANGLYNLTGIQGGSTGRVLTLMNTGSFAITLKHDQTSTAAHRFLLPADSDYKLMPGSGTILLYDGNASRWRVLSESAAETSSNVANTTVQRDGSGNFSAGTITATLSGNASTATDSTKWGGSVKTVSTGAASGGSNGDIHFKYI